MMRITLLALMLIMAFALVANAQEACELIMTDTPPVVIQGRTLLPMRAIFEWLGAKVTWDASTRHIKAWRSDITVNLWADSRKFELAYPDGDSEKGNLDVAPKIINGRTLVPLRFVAETMDCTVEYNPKDRNIHITTAAGRCGLVMLPSN